MKNKNQVVKVLVLVILISVTLFANITFAHSGRTDSSGGHKDNKNVSGLGSYHYHCGGNPAHLHTNGVCPYSSSSSSSNTSSTSEASTSSSESVTKTSTEDTQKETLNTNDTPEISVTSITLSKTNITIEIEEKVDINAVVLPGNATNKELEWSSSDKNIAVVNNGKVTGKKAGNAVITATSSNGVTATCNIVVKEEEEKESSGTVVGTVGGLGVLGGIGAFIKKRLSK